MRTEQPTDRWGSGVLSLPWYPVAIGATYVLNLWVESGVSIFAVARSLAVVTVGMVLLTATVALVTRRVHLAGAVALIAFALLVARGTQDYLGVLILAVAIPAALYLVSRIRHSSLSWSSTTRGMNILSVGLLVVVMAGGLGRGTYSALAADLQQGASTLEAVAPRAADEAGRDILVLLLDGHPREDAVGRVFGGDGSIFVEALRERGFEVAGASESNYPYTQGTLTSMFHIRPLHEIGRLDALEEGSAPAYPLLRQTLNDNPVFDRFRERGYVVVATSPGYEHVTMRSADAFLDNGSLNEVERHLIRGTVVQGVIDSIAPHAFASQHRDRIIASFDLFEQIAEWRDAGPVLAVVHVPSPHMPVVLDANGGLLDAPLDEVDYRGDPMRSDAREAYLSQLEYLDRRTLEAIDAATAERSGSLEPIIVVMSDHGGLPRVPGHAWVRDHYTNLLAVRWPSDTAHIELNDDLSPVNLFAVIANGEFGTDAGLWPDDRFPLEDFAVTNDVTQ